MVKNLPAMQQTRVRSLSREDSLEKGLATYSSTLAWKIPWTEEPDGLYSPRVAKSRTWLKQLIVLTYLKFDILSILIAIEFKRQDQSSVAVSTHSWALPLLWAAWVMIWDCHLPILLLLVWLYCCFTTVTKHPFSSLLFSSTVDSLSKNREGLYRVSWLSSLQIWFYLSTFPPAFLTNTATPYGEFLLLPSWPRHSSSHHSPPSWNFHFFLFTTTLTNLYYILLRNRSFIKNYWMN